VKPNGNIVEEKELNPTVTNNNMKKHETRSIVKLGKMNNSGEKNGKRKSRNYGDDLATNEEKMAEKEMIEGLSRLKIVKSKRNGN